MSRKAKAKSSQAEKFISSARKLECDEDEHAFDDKLKRLAQAKTKKEKAPEK